MKLPYLYCVSFRIIIYILKIATGYVNKHSKKNCSWSKYEGNAQYCPDGEFTCTDGQCIEYDRSCDGREDCSDGLDEFECEFERDMELEQVNGASTGGLEII